MKIDIKSVTAKNYGPFEEIHLPLGQMQGIFLLEGQDSLRGPDAQNGVGKSICYDPIAFALMGKSLESSGQSSEARKRLDDLVSDFPDQKKKGPMETEVILDDMRIRRGLNPKLFEVYELIDGDENLATTTFSQEKLEERWGHNWSSFQFVMRFGGGESGLKGYNSADASFHRKIQDTLVQADRITRCLETARAKIRGLNKQRGEVERDVFAAEEKVTSLKEEIEDLERREDEALTQVRSEIQEVEEALTKAQKVDIEKVRPVVEKYESLSQKLKDTETKFAITGSEAISLKERLDDLKLKVEDYEKRVMSLREDLDTVETELTSVQGKAKKWQKSLEDIREKYAAYKGAIAQRESLNQKLVACKKRINVLEDEVDDHKSEIDRALPNKPEDSDQISRHVVELEEKIVSLRAETVSIGKEISALGNPEVQLKMLEKEWDGLDQQIRGVLQEKSSIKTEVESIRNLEPGTKCPTCLGDISEEHKEAAIKVIEKKLEPLSVKLKDLRGKVEENEAETEKTRKSIDAAAKLEESLEDKNKSIRKSESELRGARERLDQSRSQRMIYDQAVMAKEQAKKALHNSEMNLLHAKTEKDETETALSSLNLPAEDLEKSLAEAERESESAIEALREKHRDQAKLNGQIESLRTSIEETLEDAKKVSADHKAKKTEAKELDAEITRIKDDMGELLDENGDPPISVDRLNDLEASIDKLQSKLKELKNQEKDGVYQELLSKKKKSLTAAKMIKKSVRARVVEIDETLPYYKFWEQGFGTDGIRPMVMREMLPVLNAQLMRYMSMLKGHQVGIAFNDQLDLQYSDWDNGHPKYYSRISSGMKMRVNIAVALAFRETISVSSGCHLPVFVSDESADSLDRVGMEGYADCLEEIAKDGTVIVITHNKFMRDCIQARASGRMLVTHENYRSQLNIE